MNEDISNLIEQAKIVLDNNWIDKFTKPSPHLYPHQWNWDSGFIAIGYARYNQTRAQEELSTLFSSQWKNGMLPQIVFIPGALGGYFPEPDFWHCDYSPNYPDNVLTSGITMPPLHAISALRIFQNAADMNASKEWLRNIYPKILAMHEYFYSERDPFKEGLVFIRHPWESGMDNSPTWDSLLKSIIIDKKKLPTYKRKDLNKGIPASQRPTDDDYHRYVFLVDLFRKLNYNEQEIFKECPFLLQDPSFNSILCKSNEDLIEIGKILGEDTAHISEWYNQTSKAIKDKLWHPDHGAFDVYDLNEKKHIKVKTCSGFMPLLCGAPTQKQTQLIYKFLDSNSFCPMHNKYCFSIPNYDLKGFYFDTKNYWRGPVWINTNWLLREGLRRYGFKEKVKSIGQDIIELVRRWDFHEYFDPYEGTGYGTNNFSWTAALFIDVALDTETTESYN